MEGQLKGHLEREEPAWSALIMAQKMADTIKAGRGTGIAHHPRSRIRSESLLAKSQARPRHSARITIPQAETPRCRMTLEASIPALHNTLDFVRDQDAFANVKICSMLLHPVTQRGSQRRLIQQTTTGIELDIKVVPRAGRSGLR